VLGLPEVRANLEAGHIWVNLAEGFVLRFDRVDEAPDPSALAYLGLELENFTAVDERFSRVSPHAPIERDMREEYRHKQGPYGFIVRDPNGYRIKIFKPQFGKATSHIPPSCANRRRQAGLCSISLKRP